MNYDAMAGRKIGQERYATPDRHAKKSLLHSISNGDILAAMAEVSHAR